MCVVCGRISDDEVWMSGVLIAGGLLSASVVASFAWGVSMYYEFMHKPIPQSPPANATVTRLDQIAYDEEEARASNIRAGRLRDPSQYLTEPQYGCDACLNQTCWTLAREKCCLSRYQALTMMDANKESMLPSPRKGSPRILLEAHSPPYKPCCPHYSYTVVRDNMGPRTDHHR